MKGLYSLKDSSEPHSVEERLTDSQSRSHQIANRASWAWKLCKLQLNFKAPKAPDKKMEMGITNTKVYL